MAAPQTQKKVGVGGCLVSILLFVLSIAAFGGLIAWAGVSVFNDLKAAPSVPLGDRGTVNITSTGQQFLFVGDLDSGGSIPPTDPLVTVTDPSGSSVRVTSPTTTSSGSSGSSSFRSIGEFNATTTGTYTIDSTSVRTYPDAKIYVASFNVGSLGAKIGIAFLVGGLLFVASVVLAIVWLVRRSRSNKASLPPPYQGGGYQGGPPAPGGYAPGPPGGYNPGAPGAPGGYAPGAPGGYPQQP